MSEPLLAVEGLTKHFPITRGLILARQLGSIRAVDGISFEVAAGETLGLVGESGCGKSTVARCVTRITRPTSGSVRFDGAEVRSLRASELEHFRRSVQMVFQDHGSSIDPRMTVARAIAEPLEVHRHPLGERISRVSELLGLVGLSDRFAGRFPHELSGGERQRVAIARAIALDPRLIIGDEPVSALDVSVRAQILNLLADLRERLGLSYLLISHDLAVVRHLSDRVAVMYLGRIIETGSVDHVFHSPAHPYTRALLSAAPVPDPEVERSRPRAILEGEVPSAESLPSGCRFRSRCPIAAAVCIEVDPGDTEIASGHTVACHFPDG